MGDGRFRLSFGPCVVGCLRRLVLGGLFLKDCKKSPWFYGVYHLQAQSSNKKGVSHRIGIDFLAELM